LSIGPRVQSGFQAPLDDGGPAREPVTESPRPGIPGQSRRAGTVCPLKRAGSSRLRRIPVTAAFTLDGQGRTATDIVHVNGVQGFEAHGGSYRGIDLS
jgi:hypothetical protein